MLISVRLVATAATLLAACSPAAYAATLGELIDSFPEPICARVVPLNYETYPSGNAPAISRMNGIEGYQGLRKFPSTDAYVTNLTVPAGTMVELRPQLEPGGNAVDGERLQSYLGGSLGWVTMKRETFRYFTSARAHNNGLFYLLSDFQMQQVTPQQFTDEGVALRSRRAAQMEVRTDIQGRGRVQLGIHAGPLPSGTTFLQVDYYTVGHWFKEVNGVQYCGKGLRYFDYAMKVQYQ
jgi:hypothetical protein